MCGTMGVIDQAKVRNKGLIGFHPSFLTVKSVLTENVSLTLVDTL